MIFFLCHTISKVIKINFWPFSIHLVQIKALTQELGTEGLRMHQEGDETASNLLRRPVGDKKDLMLRTIPLVMVTLEGESERT